MTEADGATDWRKLREFAAIDLTKSFALSWELRANVLLIDADLYLLPEHAFYEEPRPAEKVCIRAAVIEFPLCDGIVAENLPNTAEPTEVVGKLMPGAISGFRRLADGRYEICGDFGVVNIDAERPFVRLKGP